MSHTTLWDESSDAPIRLLPVLGFRFPNIGLCLSDNRKMCGLTECLGLGHLEALGDLVEARGLRRSQNRMAVGAIAIGPHDQMRPLAGNLEKVLEEKFIVFS